MSISNCLPDVLLLEWHIGVSNLTCVTLNFSSASQSCLTCLSHLSKWLLHLPTCSGYVESILNFWSSLMPYPQQFSWPYFHTYPGSGQFSSSFCYYPGLRHYVFSLLVLLCSPKSCPCLHHCPLTSKRAAKVILSKCESYQPACLLKTLQLLQSTDD